MITLFVYWKVVLLFTIILNEIFQINLFIFSIFELFSKLLHKLLKLLSSYIFVFICQIPYQALVECHILPLYIFITRDFYLIPYFIASELSNINLITVTLTYEILVFPSIKY
jgi:hypothetical protein